MAHALIETAGPFRKRLAERNAEAVIPSSSSQAPIPYNIVTYRPRNTVERLLKDYSRVATRYDNLTTKYLSGVLIAATICYWAK